MTEQNKMPENKTIEIWKLDNDELVEFDGEKTDEYYKQEYERSGLVVGEYLRSDLAVRKEDVNNCINLIKNIMKQPQVVGNKDKLSAYEQSLIVIEALLTGDENE